MSSTALDDFDTRYGAAGAPRWHIDASTLGVLEHVFSIDQFPNVDVRNQLGADLNVTPRQIQVWFQNRRQRERKRREISSKKRPSDGSPSKGSSTATSSSLSSLSLSTATLCSSSEEISSALLDEYAQEVDADAGADADADVEQQEDAKKRRGLPLAPMPRLPPAIHRDETPLIEVETASVSSAATARVSEGSPARAAASAAAPAAPPLPTSLPEARPVVPRPAAAPLPGEGEYDWQAAMRSLLPHAMSRLGGAGMHPPMGMGVGGVSGGGVGSTGMGGTGAGIGAGGTGSGASAVLQLQAVLSEQLAADLHGPVQGGAASSLSMPSVAARLAAACQSTLLGRTLQQYGGVVQSITEATPPYRLLSVSSGWQSLTGYHREEVLGRSLAFLQGPRTQRPAVAALMEAVRHEQPVSVRLINYTKDGLTFTHQLSIEPLRDPSGLTRCYQATSLVLQAPGEAASDTEVAAGQLPHISTSPLPPLWPLLGRAVRPDVPSVPSSGLGFAPPPPPLAAPPPQTPEPHDASAAAMLDDDDSFLSWLQTDASSSRGSASGDYGADHMHAEQRMNALINGIADDMQVGR